MEDSRIPVWMINAEHSVGDNGSFQFIFSQVKENKIPGLNADGDDDHAFLMKGIDTMTGDVNGFYNIAPSMGLTANSFNTMAPTAFWCGTCKLWRIDCTGILRRWWYGNGGWSACLQ